MIRVAAVLAVIAGFVPVSGHRMYYECTGTGTPTVVLDAGSPDTHAVWSAVQPALARTTRVCAYDRAGLGRSAPATGKRTVRTQAHDLLALLHNAHVSGPYVVVGHSWGGLIARVFAHAYPRQTAGVVLVDATTFPYGIPPVARKREGVDIATAQKESNAITSLGSVPLVVLGSNRPPQSAPFAKAQAAEAALSTDSVSALALRSTHYIQRPPPDGQPGVVIAAVDAVVTAVRSHHRLPSCAALFRGAAVRCN